MSELQSMKDSIHSVFKSKNKNIYINVDKFTDKEIKNLYDLCCNNEENIDIEVSPRLLYYYGKYYQHIKHDYGQMKIFYTMVADKNHTPAMYELGLYYEDVEKDYVLMKKFYMMAIYKGHSGAMNNLALYYEKKEKNINLMKYYYQMAIDKNNDTSMDNLAKYYQHVENNYDLMKKYYQMAINQGRKQSIINLKKYYLQCYEQNELCDALIFFYLHVKDNSEWNQLLAKYIGLNYPLTGDLINHLLDINQEEFPISNHFAKCLINSIKEKVDIMELHMKYAPTGEGFNEAKSDFISKLAKT